MPKSHLVPSNQLIVPSTLLSPATRIQTDEGTKPHVQKYLRLDR